MLQDPFSNEVQTQVVAARSSRTLVVSLTPPESVAVSRSSGNALLGWTRDGTLTDRPGEHSLDAAVPTRVGDSAELQVRLRSGV
jgi:hypothetical protein